MPLHSNLPHCGPSYRLPERTWADLCCCIASAAALPPEQVQMFGAPDKLPVLRKVGDIMRIHRLRISSFAKGNAGATPQLVATLHPGQAAYCLFHAEPSQSPEMPYAKNRCPLSLRRRPPAPQSRSS